MHQCVKKEINFLAWYKKSGQERREEARCSVCRILFCCSENRENHEDIKHGGEMARMAHQQRQIRKENKPLVCLSCCQVFLSGLLIANDSCNNGGTNKDEGTPHVLITIPDWAVAKYLVPNQRKRPWDKANEDCAKVEIRVQLAADKSVEDCIPSQENSSTQKCSIQSILTKQRKTELSIKRGRRVTFSPVTAVAITSKHSIVKVETGKTGGESSSDSASSPSVQPLGATPEPEPSVNCLYPTDSTAETKPNADKVSPGLQSTTIESCGFSPSVEHKGEKFVFSPPLPDEGTNGSPMMAPQMSSTPVCDHSERRTASTSAESPSEFQTTSEASGSNDGIFSSLANMICCAFQALPSVLTQFFASVNSETDPNDHNKKEGRVGCERRFRRRSATFTPYLPVPQKRGLNRQKLHGPTRPLPYLDYPSLRSDTQQN